MFIAHLPAGYLLTRWLQQRLKTTEYLWIGLAASILPDSDLVYFYFIDNRQTLHHEYWIHLPIFWLTVWIAVLVVNLLAKSRKLSIVSTIFLANIFLHLILDTFAAGILWLYPLWDKSFVLIDVPARYSSWVENFIFHWSFLVEILIFIWASAVLLKERKKNHLD
ncbi:metal-dependent hydrolase [Candidatus Uhrbacteria bacterium]|nr:metal-dependent hydrolase [Candidatus Uhrbacteria bacterium]